MYYYLTTVNTIDIFKLYSSIINIEVDYLLVTKFIT